jgi:hypothetical protein
MSTDSPIPSPLYRDGRVDDFRDRIREVVNEYRGLGLQVTLDVKTDGAMRWGAVVEIRVEPER